MMVNLVGTQLVKRGLLDLLAWMDCLANQDHVVLQVTEALMGCVVRKAKLELPLCLDKKETKDLQDNQDFQVSEASQVSLEAKATLVQRAPRVNKATVDNLDLMDNQDVMDLPACQVWLAEKVLLVTVVCLVVMELQD